MGNIEQCHHGERIENFFSTLLFFNTNLGGLFLFLDFS